MKPHPVGSRDTYSPPLREGIGKTVVLSASKAGSPQWWISKNGKAVANDRVLLSALKTALRGEQHNDIVSVEWRDAPDGTVPLEFHSALATVSEWLKIGE
jgi:hypothetical protein